MSSSVDVCSRCQRPLTGDLQVVDEDLPDGTWMVAITSSPARNWLCCDGCNVVLCHACCSYPASGYCDACIQRYTLYDDLLERNLVDHLYYCDDCRKPICPKAGYIPESGLCDTCVKEVLEAFAREEPDRGEEDDRGG